MNKLSILIVCTVAFISLNSVAAQSSEVYLDCGDQLLEPGEERECFAQFSSEFNWSDYDYNWSVSSGEITHQSVESVSFIAPKKASSSEVIVDGSVTDGSGEAYRFEKTVEIESQEVPEMPRFEVICENDVKAGAQSQCDVEWYSRPDSNFDHSWTVEGPGKVEGNRSSAVYEAPESVDQIQRGSSASSTVVLTVYGPQDKSQASDSIELEDSRGDNSELRQKIREQKTQIEKQRRRIRNQSNTIERQRATIEDLRETLNELRKEESWNQNSSQSDLGNGSKTDRPDEPINNSEESDAKESKERESPERKEKESSQDSLNNSDSNAVNRSEKENKPDSDQGNQSGDKGIKRESDRSSGSFVDVIRKLLG